MGMEEIAKQVYECKRCPLWKTRNKPVIGEGNENAEIVLIGMGPGVEEDKHGKPFIGKAGRFLDELLSIANLRREEIYITNVIKCFLPNNEVKEEYVKACSPYLERQLNMINPKIIVCLGNVAKEFVFKKYGLENKPISEIHGKIYQINSLFGKKYIVVMFHPSAGLRNPSLRPVIEEDWRKFAEFLRR